MTRIATRVAVLAAFTAVSAHATVISLTTWESGTFEGWTPGSGATLVDSSRPDVVVTYDPYYMLMQDKSVQIKAGGSGVTTALSQDFTSLVGLTDVYVSFLVDISGRTLGAGRNAVAFDSSSSDTAEIGYLGSLSYGVRVGAVTMTVPLTPTETDADVRFIIGRLYDSNADNLVDTFSVWISPSGTAALLGAPSASAFSGVGLALDGGVRIEREGTGGSVEYGHIMLSTSGDDIVSVPEAAAFWPALLALSGVMGTMVVRRVRASKTA